MRTSGLSQAGQGPMGWLTHHFNIERFECLKILAAFRLGQCLAAFTHQHGMDDF